MSTENRVYLTDADYALLDEERRNLDFQRRYDLQRQLVENVGLQMFSAGEGDAVAEIEGWDFTNPAAVYVPEFAAPVQEDADVSVKQFGWLLVLLMCIWVAVIVAITTGLYFLFRDWGLVAVMWIGFIGLIGIRFAITSVRMGGR